MLSWGHFAASSKQTEKSSGHALLLKQQSLLLSLSPDHSSSQSGQLISHLPIRGSFLECGRPSRAQSWQELGTTSWEMALLLSGCLWCGAFFLSSAVSCFICCRPGERQGHCSMMPNAGRRNHTMALAGCLPKWVRWHMWVPWRLRVPAGPEEALLTWPLLLCGASCISSPSFRITIITLHSCPGPASPANPHRADAKTTVAHNGTKEKNAQGTPQDMCTKSSQGSVSPAQHRQAPAVSWWQLSKVAFAIWNWQQLLLQSPLGGSGSLARATKCEKRTPKATWSVPLGKAGLHVSVHLESPPRNRFCHYPFPGYCPRSSWEAANIISKA